MRAPLQFGTDGWRGIIADTFTFENLERIAQATAVVLSPADGARVVVGHDRRFLAAAHGDRVGEVLAAAGFRIVRSQRSLPTPALAGLVVEHSARAGIMLTASHNPPEFGGYKVKLDFGGSAPTEFTRRIERGLDTVPPRRLDAARARADGCWEDVEFEAPYFRRLAGRIDREALATGPPLTVVVDSMHGAGGRLIARFLASTPHRVITLRGDRDVTFGGAGPEPVPERLQELAAVVVAEGADLGLATDGDADRLAAVDESGRFLSALQITPLLAAHLIEARGEPGDLAKTTANTVLLDRLARAHGRRLHVRPIGFKNLVPLFRDGNVLIGGEESGGLGVAGYLPERDGVLMGLLLLEARLAAGRPISAMLARLWAAHGEFHYRRRDLFLPAARAAEVVERLGKSPPGRLAGLPVTGVGTSDGTRVELGEAGWIMVRRSGTEPILRVYCEARTLREVEALLDAVSRLAGA